MKNIKISFLVLLSLNACTKSKSKKSNVESNSTVIEDSTSYSVQSVSDLPNCNSSRQNYLSYIQSSSNFKVCDNSNWVDIQIPAIVGPQGEQGIPANVAYKVNMVLKVLKASKVPREQQAHRGKTVLTDRMAQMDQILVCFQFQRMHSSDIQ